LGIIGNKAGICIDSRAQIGLFPAIGSHYRGATPAGIGIYGFGVMSGI
jgi:hypothetical protein